LATSDHAEQRMEDNHGHDEADIGKPKEADVGCSPGLGVLAHVTIGSKKGCMAHDTACTLLFSHTNSTILFFFMVDFFIYI
jgi:hypothetical protein